MEIMSKAMADGTLEALIEKEKDPKKARQEELRREYGANAQVVEKYKPNRKQKRAQEAAKRRQAAKARSRT